MASKKGEGKGKSRPWSRNWKGRGKGKGKGKGDQTSYTIIPLVEMPESEIQIQTNIEHMGVNNRRKNPNSRKYGAYHNNKGMNNGNYQQQYNRNSSDSMMINENEEQMHQMGQNFCVSLQQLSYKNDEKYELMCGILTELQNRQNILEGIVQRFQTLRQETKQQQANNLYAAAYCPAGMVMPMLSEKALMLIGDEIQQPNPSEKKNNKKTTIQVDAIRPTAKGSQKSASPKQTNKKCCKSQTYDLVDKPTATQKQIQNQNTYASYDYEAPSKGNKWCDHAQEEYDYYWNTSANKKNKGWEYDNNDFAQNKKGKKGGYYDASSVYTKKWRKTEQVSEVEQAPLLKKGRAGPGTPKKYQDKQNGFTTPAPAENTKIMSATTQPFSPKKAKNNANAGRRVDPLLVLPMSPKKDYPASVTSPISSPKKTDWSFDSRERRTTCWADEIPYPDIMPEVSAKTNHATTQYHANRSSFDNNFNKRIVPEPLQIDSNGGQRRDVAHQFIDATAYNVDQATASSFVRGSIEILFVVVLKAW
eukprot:GEMP01004539.1.p1 GENE.GEMP01004539.1~~GEMP01004539.1.p1  ORF type:complete len:531 (+),score=86.07 GEMP01004539.1:2216-3808(+)